MVDKNTEYINVTANPKGKVKYLVSHSYTGNTAMKTAFFEMVENKIEEDFEKWKERKIS